MRKPRWNFTTVYRLARHGLLYSVLLSLAILGTHVCRPFAVSIMGRRGRPLPVGDAA